MRHAKTIITLALVFGLLASPAAVVAQEAEGMDAAPTWLEIRTRGQGHDISGAEVELDGGFAIREGVRPDYILVAEDTRASGGWMRIENSDFYGDADGPVVMVSTTSQHIKSGAGWWAGTGIAVGELGPFDPEGPPNSTVFSYAQLDGEGENAGLTLVMVEIETPESGPVWRGMIIPSEQIPPMPDPVVVD